MSVRPELLLNEADAVVGVVENVMISVFCDTTLNRLYEVARVSSRRFARESRGAASLVVLDRDSHKTAAVDTSVDRVDFGAGMNRVGSFIRATAVVVEFNGFTAATMRGFITGVSLVARLSYPLKSFDRLGDGAQWLVPIVTEPARVADVTARVLAGIAALRALRSNAFGTSPPG